MDKSDLLDELSLKVDGLQFIVEGLNSLTENPPADMTVEKMQEQRVKFCYLALNQLEEMHKLIKGAVA